MTEKVCHCPTLTDGNGKHRILFGGNYFKAGKWTPIVLSRKDINGRLRHPKYLVCAMHAVTYDVARCVIQCVTLPDYSKREIEKCIALAIAQPSIGAASGPFATVLSIAARKNAAGGCTFGNVARGATYVVRSICLALLNLPFGDYLLAHLLSFVVGGKATQALLNVTTTGVRCTEKTKTTLMARHADKTSLESLVIAVRRSADYVRKQRSAVEQATNKMVCRNCGSHDIIRYKTE